MVNEMLSRIFTKSRSTFPGREPSRFTPENVNSENQGRSRTRTALNITHQPEDNLEPRQCRPEGTQAQHIPAPQGPRPIRTAPSHNRPHHRDLGTREMGPAHHRLASPLPRNRQAPTAAHPAPPALPESGRHHRDLGNPVQRSPNAAPPPGPRPRTQAHRLPEHP